MPLAHRIAGLPTKSRRVIGEEPSKGRIAFTVPREFIPVVGRLHRPTEDEPPHESNDHDRSNADDPGPQHPLILPGETADRERASTRAGWLEGGQTL